MDKDGNELDGECSRPQKHAKSPELAREFLLDAATIIFKEQACLAFTLFFKKVYLYASPSRHIYILSFEVFVSIIMKDDMECTQICEECNWCSVEGKSTGYN